MKIVEEDLSLCHSLAAAMQKHWLELVQYIDTGVLVLPANQQVYHEPFECAAVAVRTLHHPLKTKPCVQLCDLLHVAIKFDLSFLRT